MNQMNLTLHCAILPVHLVHLVTKEKKINSCSSCYPLAKKNNQVHPVLLVTKTKKLRALRVIRWQKKKISVIRVIC